MGILRTFQMNHKGQSMPAQVDVSKATMGYAFENEGEVVYSYIEGQTIIATPDWQLPAGTKVMVGNAVYKTTTDMNWLAQVNALGGYFDPNLAHKLIEWGYIGWQEVTA